MNIFESVKKALGLHEEDNSFDEQLTIYIESVIDEIRQAGPDIPTFQIDSPWSLIIDPCPNVEGIIRSYILLSVELLFDPPTSSSSLEYKKSILERMLWRIREGTRKDVKP